MIAALVPGLLIDTVEATLDQMVAASGRADSCRPFPTLVPDWQRTGTDPAH